MRNSEETNTKLRTWVTTPIVALTTFFYGNYAPPDVWAEFWDAQIISDSLDLKVMLIPFGFIAGNKVL